MRARAEDEVLDRVEADVLLVVVYHESQQAELCFREVKAFVLGK